MNSTYIFRFFLTFLFWCLTTILAYAQPDTTHQHHQHAEDTTISIGQEGIQISILTCGVGNELYSSFGHTGVRIIDTIMHTDEVYNYGMFNFSDPDFYSKFTLGKLPYYVAKESYQDFMSTYVYEKRNVQEQILQLTTVQKRAIINYLEQNILPENKQYKYDFLFDNCATRVRDIFPKLWGDTFQFSSILNGKKITYRNILNQYLAYQHWERFGINLLLGSKIDVYMTDEGTMFLPDFLHKGLAEARIQNQAIVKRNVIVLDHKIMPETQFNGPLWLNIALLILTIVSFFIPKLSALKKVMTFLLLFITGLLGCFMLFMWFGTNHQSCTNNFNILWALPTNIFVAFLVFKSRSWLKIYALLAISLLIVALLLHVITMQQIPLIELSPLLLSMMYIYVDLYKRNIGIAPAAPKA
jgi:hypothetical protein